MSDLMKIDVALKGYDTALCILNSAIDAINEAKAIVLQYGATKPEILVCGEGELTAQPEIIHCKDCKNSEHWYRDRRRCFLWSEDGVSVFDDGFCNYAERRTDDY